MKFFIAIPLLLSTAAAFTPGNKPTVKSSSVGSSVTADTDRPEKSASLPFLNRPPLLDGSLPGDRGFDPLGFASSEKALDWQRTAEIKHGRIAMLAAAGWPAAELIDKKIAAAYNLPALLGDGDRVPSILNGGLSKVPPAFWAATLGVAAAIECLGKAKADQARREGGIYTPGDLGFDPFEFKALTKEGRFYEAEAELFNGRLAMLGIAGFVFQELVTKEGVVNETPFFFHNPF